MKTRRLVIRKSNKNSTILNMIGDKITKEVLFSTALSANLIKESLIEQPYIQVELASVGQESMDTIARAPYISNKRNMIRFSHQSTSIEKQNTCVFCEQIFNFYSHVNCNVHPICSYCLKHLFVNYVTSSFLAECCPFKNCLNRLDFSNFSDISVKFSEKLQSLKLESWKFALYYNKFKKGHILDHDLGNALVISCIKCREPTLQGQTSRSSIICTSCNFRFCKYCFKEKLPTCCKEKEYQFKPKNSFWDIILFTWLAALVVVITLTILPYVYFDRGRSKFARISAYICFFPFMLFFFVIALPFASLIQFMLRS